MSNTVGGPTNPAWLQALLAQMYPGGGSNVMANTFHNPDMPLLPAVNQGATGFRSPPPAISPIVPSSDPRGPDAAMNRMTGMNVPTPVGGIRNPAAPPVPNPSLVGGAPAPGVPAPQNYNRTANNPPVNPNFSEFQYNVPGNAQGGRNSPIYTAGNFGGPANAGWGTQSQPPGALAAPRGNPSNTPRQSKGLDLNDPDYFFTPEGQNAGFPLFPTRAATGTPYGPSPDALPQAQKYGWPFNMMGGS